MYDNQNSPIDNLSIKAKIGYLSALFAACYSPPKPAERPRASQLMSDVWHSITSNMLVGRVTLHGQPVTFFGVTLSRNHEFAHPTPPIEVRDSEGRFTVPVAPGKWDLVIVGPGFGKHVVSNIVAERNKTLMPLTISVERGHTVDGEVKDVNGNPISGANVLIWQGGIQTDNYLWNLSIGNHSTKSDINGRFQIHDVVFMYDFALISGSAVGGMSQKNQITMDNRSSILEILPVGSLAGRVSFVPKPKYTDNPLVVAISLTHPKSRYVADIQPNGSFRLGNVPAGEYEVGLLSTSDSNGTHVMKRISVVANKETQIAL